MYIDHARSMSLQLDEHEFSALTEKLSGLYALDLEPAFAIDNSDELVMSVGVARDMNEKGLQKSHKSEG
jgi:hypothetical protein